MTENKENDSMNVHYEITKEDYNLLANYAKQLPDLQKILARARLVKNDKAPVAPVKFLDIPVATALTPKHVVKERLTDEVGKRLFGANYYHVCIYNDENHAFKWEDCWFDSDVLDSKKLKASFETTFYHKFEMVALVTMQVSKECNPGYSKWSIAPVNFDKNGEYTVGNLVIRNKKTGKLELLKSDAWFGVDGHENPSDAGQCGVNKLAKCGAEDWEFRTRFFAGRRQR